MKFWFIEQHRHLFPVARMCHVLGISSNGYYAFRRRPPSRRARENQRLLLQIRAIHRASRETYGYRRIDHELRARDRVEPSPDCVSDTTGWITGQIASFVQDHNPCQFGSVQSISNQSAELLHEAAVCQFAAGMSQSGGVVQPPVPACRPRPG